MDREKAIAIAGPLALLAALLGVVGLVASDPPIHPAVEPVLQRTFFWLVVLVVGLPLWGGPVLLIVHRDHPVWRGARGWLPVHGKWLSITLALMLAIPGLLFAGWALMIGLDF